MHSSEFIKLVEDSKKRIKEVTIETVVQKLRGGERFHFVDTREDSEWIEGHAASAIHIGKGVIERDIESEIPDKNSEIVLYCGGGYRSALAADALQKMGYKNVYSMDGGMRAWRAAGLPVESGL